MTFVALIFALCLSRQKSCKFEAKRKAKGKGKEADNGNAVVASHTPQ
jgi:hypothetical protein